MNAERIGVSVTGSMRSLWTGIDDQLFAAGVDHDISTAVGERDGAHRGWFIRDAVESTGSIRTEQPQRFFGRGSRSLLEVAAAKRHRADSQRIKEVLAAIAIGVEYATAIIIAKGGCRSGLT